MRTKLVRAFYTTAQIFLMKKWHSWHYSMPCYYAFFGLKYFHPVRSKKISWELRSSFVYTSSIFSARNKNGPCDKCQWYDDDRIVLPSSHGWMSCQCRVPRGELISGQKFTIYFMNGHLNFKASSFRSLQNHKRHRWWCDDGGSMQRTNYITFT